MNSRQSERTLERMASRTMVWHIVTALRLASHDVTRGLVHIITHINHAQQGTFASFGTLTLEVFDDLSKLLLSPTAW
jgi:hypothetical protein